MNNWHPTSIPWLTGDLNIKRKVYSPKPSSQSKFSSLPGRHQGFRKLGLWPETYDPGNQQVWMPCQPWTPACNLNSCLGRAGPCTCSQPSLLREHPCGTTTPERPRAPLAADWLHGTGVVRANGGPMAVLGLFAAIRAAPGPWQRVACAAAGFRGRCHGKAYAMGPAQVSRSSGLVVRPGTAGG